VSDNASAFLTQPTSTGAPRVTHLDEDNYAKQLTLRAPYDAVVFGQLNSFVIESKNYHTKPASVQVFYSSPTTIAALQTRDSGLSRSYLDALRTLALAVKNSTYASQIASSQRNVFQHVVSDEQIILDRDQISDLLDEQQERLYEVARERANIEAFQRTLRAFYGDSEAVASHTNAIVRNRRPKPTGYWSGIRTDLQDWFRVGLQPLSELTRVSKGTLLSLAQPDRDLRGPTVRKLHAIHASAKAIVESEGDRGLTWLQTVGADVLRKHAIEQFESAVDDRLLRHRIEDYVIGSASIEVESPPEVQSNASVSAYKGLKGSF
jgi:hypothetical protein